MANALKAYVVRDKDYYRDFATVVFARNRNEARSLAMRTDACEDLSYIEIAAKRKPELDNSYRGRWEMDWDNTEDRIDLVRLGGFSCSDEIVDWYLDCENCSASKWCDRYQDGRADNG